MFCWLRFSAKSFRNNGSNVDTRDPGLVGPVLRLAFVRFCRGGGEGANLVSLHDN